MTKLCALNNQQVNKEIKKEINTWSQMKTKTQQAQNLWDAAKTGLRGKFKVLQGYLKKEEKYQIFLH